MPRFRFTWSADDLRGAAIAVGAFDSMAEAKRFCDAARAVGVPVNVIDKPAFCDFSFGAIVNCSPLVIGISTDGAAPVFAQAIRAKLEALLPKSKLCRLGVGRRALARCGEGGGGGWPRPAQVLAAVHRARDAHPTASRTKIISTASRGAKGLGAAVENGSVTLVGAGPGDPELLTLRAVRALQSADQHLVRFAPGEVEHISGDEIVEQNDVRRLQRAHGAQREQLGIAGTGADQRDRAVLDGRAQAFHLGDEAVEIILVRRAVGMPHRVRGEQLPELAPAGERQPRRLHRIAPARGGRGPGGKAVRQQRLQLGADRLRKHRRRAVGRNADHQRRAVDDGAEGEVAERRFVDHIDRDAYGTRGIAKAFCLGIGVEGANGDGGAAQIVRTPLIHGVNLNLGAGGLQQLQLPGRGLPAADQHRALSSQREEHRQARQRAQARRRQFKRFA